MGGPHLPGESEDEEGDENFWHAISHAEDLAEDINDPRFSAQAWATIAVAWATYLRAE